MTGRPQSRAWYIGAALGTIALGLGLHQVAGSLTAGTRDKLGDALWAAMIAWWIGALAPTAALRVRIAAALAVCFVVESSQLLHVEVLDSMRHTRLGQLVLGSGFDARDLAAYAVGVLTAGLLEFAVTRQMRRRTASNMR
jgi:hypothetical protein